MKDSRVVFRMGKGSIQGPAKGQQPLKTLQCFDDRPESRNSETSIAESLCRLHISEHLPDVTHARYKSGILQCLRLPALRLRRLRHVRPLRPTCGRDVHLRGRGGPAGQGDLCGAAGDLSEEKQPMSFCRMWAGAWIFQADNTENHPSMRLPIRPLVRVHTHTYRYLIT